MSGREQIRVLLDADLSSKGLIQVLGRLDCDVLAAGLSDDLKQLDDEILFAVCQEQRRILITHNCHDYPAILRDWAESGRQHHGCILSFLPTNAYGEMHARLSALLRQFPTQIDWLDRVVAL